MISTLTIRTIWIPSRPGAPFSLVYRTTRTRGTRVKEQHNSHQKDHIQVQSISATSTEHGAVEDLQALPPGLLMGVRWPGEMGWATVSRCGVRDGACVRAWCRADVVGTGKPSLMLTKWVLPVTAACQARRCQAATSGDGVANGLSRPGDGGRG